MEIKRRTLIKSLIAIAACPLSLLSGQHTESVPTTRELGMDEEILAGDVMLIPGVYCDTLSRVWKGTTPRIIVGGAESIRRFEKNGTSSKCENLEKAIFLRKI